MILFFSSFKFKTDDLSYHEALYNLYLILSLISKTSSNDEQLSNIYFVFDILLKLINIIFSFPFSLFSISKNFVICDIRLL